MGEYWLYTRRESESLTWVGGMCRRERKAVQAHAKERVKSCSSSSEMACGGGGGDRKMMVWL